MNNQRGVSARLVALVAVASIASLVVCLGIFATRTFTTTFGERISRYDDYVFISGETLSQEDLERIAAIPNLEYLSLTDCNVGECRLPELTFKSKKLREINLSGTKGLWDLSFLSRVTASTVCLDNCTDVSDLSFLNLESLEDLSIDGTDVTDLSPLEGANLRALSFAHTKVKDLSPLANMNGLWRVDGSYTRVTSLDVLTDKRSIGSLEFNGCAIKELKGPLATNYLGTVGLAETQITDFTALSGCVGMYELNLSGCKGLDDISWLNSSNYEGLRTLDLSRTALKSDDLTWIGTCTNLRELRLDGIELGNLDLCKKLDSLTLLSAVGCGITDASGITHCKELNTLLLGYNHVQDLSVLPRPNTEWNSMLLDLSHNELTSLRGLPAGGYRILLLHGNDPDLGRTVPSDVTAYAVVLSWFAGIDDTRFADYENFSMLYLLDCPEDRVGELEKSLGTYRATLLSEEELWQLLLDDELAYSLFVDMEGYVTYAQSAVQGS